MLAWAREAYDIEILTFDSIFMKPQPAETVAKLDHVMSKLDHWEMAGQLVDIRFTAARLKKILFSFGESGLHLQILHYCSCSSNEAYHR